MDTTAPSTPQPRYAGFWIRFAAITLDGILLTLVQFMLAFIALILGFGYKQSNPGSMSALEYIEWGYIQIAVVIPYVMPAALVYGCWSVWGSTPGKMLVSTKIVDAKTGRQPSQIQWAIRMLGYILTALPLGLGFVWMAFDRRKQGWHDKLAGTVVVRGVWRMETAIQPEASGKATAA